MKDFVFILFWFIAYYISNRVTVDLDNSTWLMIGAIGGAITSNLPRLIKKMK